ncbi:MAG: Membrane-associated lipoprotein involved in thiamine biosynthesis [Oscillospiraceae bacterium]|nr:Membrane-associated lipoprotein involved in thiamine biosynthesis [Oscillospiraceae bacterium]
MQKRNQITGVSSGVKIAVLVMLLGLMAGCGSASGASGTSSTSTMSADVSSDITSTPATTTVFAMDTVMQLTAYGGDDALMQEASDRITALDSLLSTTNPDSEIYALNAQGTATVSPDTAALVEDGIKYGQLTGGLLDVTIYPVVRAWGFTTGEYQIPDADTLTELLKTVDYRSISFDADTSVVTLPEGVMVDFGSLAKGYTGDVLLKLFADNGITSAMVNLGGNVQTLGAKPDGSAWRVGIEDPSGDDYLGIVSVVNKTVITSGGYERYFTGDDGTVYWHIFDPRTGYPAKTGLLSVSIITDTGIYAEALSTSLFVMGLDQASDFWREHRDFEAVFITEDGDVYITSGLENSFTLSDTDTGRTLTVIQP